VISNIGAHGHQEVPHLHMHVLGGGPIGRLVADQ
jgi:diadenosine tetraphosphate (Ap4A) HIT family hydrolase